MGTPSSRAGWRGRGWNTPPDSPVGSSSYHVVDYDPDESPEDIVQRGSGLKQLLWAGTIYKRSRHAMRLHPMMHHKITLMRHWKPFHLQLFTVRPAQKTAPFHLQLSRSTPPKTASIWMMID
jgi:hypothetical protein